MKTFFYLFVTEPCPSHPQFYDLGGALAHAWVLADSQEAGEVLARQEIERHQWDILGFEGKASGETRPEQYVDQAAGLANYYKAQKLGIALAFAAYDTGGDS